MKKNSSAYLLFFLLWLMLHSTAAHAQKSKIDSLKKILTQTTDTARVHTLNHLAYELYYDQPRVAITYAEEALALARDMQYKKGLAESNDLLGRSYSELDDLKKTLKYYLESASYYKLIDEPIKLGEEYNEIGVVYKILGQYDKALQYFTLALEIFEADEFQNGKGNALINIGQVYSYLGNYEKAIEHYIKSIKIWEDLQDENGLALAHGNLGNLYYNLKEYKKALEYFNVAEKLFRKLGENFMLANVLNNIGLIYNNFQDNEKALEYFESALALSKELNYKSGMAFGLSNIGRIYQDQKKYEEAVEQYESALQLFKETGNKSLVAGRLNDLGEVYTMLGDFEEAYSKLTEGLEIAKETNDAERELISYKALFEYYEVTKNYNLSLEYYKKYSALKDSVYNIQKSEQIAEIQTRYETQKKEQENELLRKEKAIREETITRKEAQNRMLLIGILFILSFAGYFYIVYRQKQKTNYLLSRQNEEINLKQQEIINVNASLQESQEQLFKANEELQRLNANLETTVRERTSALEKSNVELDTFLYQSSHALRRPIVSIMGLVQVVRLESKQSQIDLIRDKIEDTAKKMDVMLRKLVMASEINISQFDPVKPIDFKAIIEETWETLSKNFETSNICFKSVVDPMDNFLSKDVLIRILFYNILENAILYSVDPALHHTKIKVAVSKLEGGVDIQVLDNGIGIARELTDRIFDMFIVATEKPKGFGLGLYIVKKAIEKLNGTVKVKTKENQYTCFQIFIPFSAASIPAGR